MFDVQQFLNTMIPEMDSMVMGHVPVHYIDLWGIFQNAVFVSGVDEDGYVDLSPFDWKSAYFGECKQDISGNYVRGRGTTYEDPKRKWNLTAHWDGGKWLAVVAVRPATVDNAKQT